MEKKPDFLRPLWEDLPYSRLISGLPEIDVPLAGVRGWLLQGLEKQVAFFDIEAIGAIPAHSHGEQWGIVVRGEMKLTVGGVTCHLKAGDWYHVPAGVEHSAEFLTRFQAIDVFDDPDRWSAKP